jgi:hypothetical protein
MSFFAWVTGVNVQQTEIQPIYQAAYCLLCIPHTVNQLFHQSAASINLYTSCYTIKVLYAEAQTLYQGLQRDPCKLSEDPAKILSSLSQILLIMLKYIITNALNKSNFNSSYRPLGDTDYTDANPYIFAVPCSQAPTIRKSKISRSS